MMLTIVGVYLAVLLGIGWWCHRHRISGMTDFLLAGRKLGVVLCAAAMAATHFGGGALLGGASLGFEHGLSGAWYGISTGLGLLLLALLTAGRFRALALYTVPDYLASRYGGRAVRVLGTVLSLAALVGILAAQVNAARGAFSIIGLEGPEAAVLATLVFITYTAFGGLWAAVLSDVVQIAIAGVGVVLAGAVVLYRTGGLGGLREALAAEGVGAGYLTLTGAGSTLILGLLLPTVMYTLIGQDFYQRLFAARERRRRPPRGPSGRPVPDRHQLLSRRSIGMGARGSSPGPFDDKHSGGALGAPEPVLGPVLGGIILAAILAAIMSTADSLLTAATCPRGQGSVGRDPGARRRWRRESASCWQISRGSTVAGGFAGAR